ncbi:MAG: FhaA domain-containing protein [Mycobacteriales bacterium]
MGVLQRFEKRLGVLVEGAFAKVFRGGVEPVEIAGALARETDDKRAIGPSRTLVPNEFTVELAPADHGRLAPFEQALAEELSEMVREHATEQRYSFVGRVAVSFVRDDDLSVGMFRVRSGVSAEQAAASSEDSPIMEYDAGLTAGPRLVLEEGESLDEASGGAGRREFPLQKAEVLVGRSLEVDIRLAHTGVSRRHARLQRVDGAWWLHDLGSTNGTLVNGRPVTEAELADGDRIELGGTVLVYHDDRRGPGRG